MRYDVQKLREATEKAIAAERALAEERHAERVAQYQERAAEWTEKHAEQWRAAATAVGRRIRAGKPVRRADLPRGNYDRIAVFGETPPGKFEHSTSRDLTVLTSALALVTDDTVSPAELGRLGVRAPELRTVLELARSDA
ncbi:hypothetical protein [Amycolatopsis rubida]|uniref:Uncharacterized protein n=1 Tax=Amycolatopsis rubida TaxID=112413 RepID=A0A1I5IJP5_9PSEU|nr:hypothetical protein [Amycolatopsis rubida]SFO60436.1 hypothetical protein SAMN05421854_102496 [Amycolatopsis rubida]